MKLAQPNLRRARIEIIPMIDTIFFLLVFFMIAWLTMVNMNGMPTTLPKHAEAGDAAPEAINLSMSPSGEYFINSRHMGSDEWQGILFSALLDHPNAVIVVNVASNQNTQALITTLDKINTTLKKTHSDSQVLIATPKITPLQIKVISHVH